MPTPNARSDARSDVPSDGRSGGTSDGRSGATSDGRSGGTSDGRSGATSGGRSTAGPSGTDPALEDGERPVAEGALGDLGGFIRHQREVARMSVRRLAEMAEVSNPYLSQIERGLRRPSAEILQQIAKALRISAEQLYVRAGILDPESAIELSVPDAISRDPRLSADQKRSMLTVYESFVAGTVS